MPDADVTKKGKYSDAFVFRVAQRFLEEGANLKKGVISTRKIAEDINREFPKLPPLNRESIYRRVRDAIERDFIRLVPPVDKRLAGALAAQFPNLQADHTCVVETAGKTDNAKVAVVAAELTIERIRKLDRYARGETVGLGLGPGRATLDFCQHFGRRVAAELPGVKLALYGISAGCPPFEPEYASISFFNLFPRHLIARQAGLFAETLVHAREFADIKLRTGVRQVFEARDEIDILVTSMGDFYDEDDLLAKFLQDSKDDVAQRRAEGWIGNVQYRPYSAQGPIKEEPNDLRAVTLFELEDLVRLAERRQKHVILIARQCGHCGRTRADALRPLLTNPALKVFTWLVVDAVSADELMRRSEPKPDATDHSGVAGGEAPGSPGVAGESLPASRTARSRKHKR